MARKLNLEQKKQPAGNSQTRRGSRSETEQEFVEHLADQRNKAMQLSPELDAGLSMPITSHLLG